MKRHSCPEHKRQRGEKSFSSVRSVFFVAVTALMGSLFIGVTPSFISTVSSQAQESNPCETKIAHHNTDVADSDEDVKAASLYNGYCIHNDSNATLTLQPENPHHPRQPYKNGWGTQPPEVIFPGQKVYFEVKYWWGWPDDSTLVYTTSQGDTVTFHANVVFDLFEVSDRSDFTASLGTGEVIPSQGRTSQTIFRYTPPTSFKSEIIRKMLQ